MSTEKDLDDMDKRMDKEEKFRFMRGYDYGTKPTPNPCDGNTEDDSLAGIRVLFWIFGIAGAVIIGWFITKPLFLYALPYLETHPDIVCATSATGVSLFTGWISFKRYRTYQGHGGWTFACVVFGLVALRVWLMVKGW